MNEVKNVENCLAELKKHLAVLLQSLNSRDLETFVDLVFRASGWSRIGEVGKTLKGIDLELMLPVTGERASVQIKTKGNLSDYIKYKNMCQKTEKHKKGFFIVHAPSKDLKSLIDNQKGGSVLIYDTEKLAELCINAGLIDWLMASSR